VGQRLAVRNSGASCVVEGAGEHACEYMTGGLVVILGSVGRNLGAAMTGGRVFVYDQDEELQSKLNHDSVQALPLLESSDLDQAELRQWVERHQQSTGSQVATEILADWQQRLGRFWLVKPRLVPLAPPMVRGAERVTKR